MSNERRPDDQATIWNGVSGRAWIETQELLDRTFKPFEDLLVDAAVSGSASHVLDVGCGTGGTTLAIARALGAKGSGVGVDISEPMLAVARARADQEHSTATFITDDAERHIFEPGSFDLIVSRFGIMFFADPVRAFANLRHAMRPAGRFHCIAWRGPADNPFVTTAERAAAPILPDIPPRQPNAPGQFSLADRNRIVAILSASGWSQIDVKPIDVPCSFPAKELERFFTRLGPLGRILDQADDALRRRVIRAVHEAFAPYVHGEEVRFVAGCWIVAARA